MIELAIFKNIKQSILKDLANSTAEIKIAVAWFTNHEFYDLLLKKLRSGIKVTLIIINDPINNREGGLEWQNFIDLGGLLHFSYYPKIMHHKFCLIDNQILYNGSYNWTYYAEKINRENTVRFFDCPNLIESFDIEFEQLILKYKISKRIKKHKLDDLLKFQIDRAYSFYFIKELEANSKWLKRMKNHELAEKVLTASLKFDLKNTKEKLKPLKVSVQKLSKKKSDDKLFNSTINKELFEIKQRKIQLNYQDNNILNKTLPKITENLKYIPNEHVEIKRKEELLKSLKKEGLQGDFGELRINLKWETYDDLDLHIFDPLKNHIYYYNKEVILNDSKGQLDVDANAGDDRRLNPQENVFWKINPPSGRYKIIVDHYAVKQNKEVPFIISIISKKGKSLIIYAKVHYEDLKTIFVAEFKFVKGQGVIEILEKKVKTTIS